MPSAQVGRRVALEVVGATGVSASALVFVVKGDLAAFEHASKTPKCATPNTIKHGLSDLGGDIDRGVARVRSGG